MRAASAPVSLRGMTPHPPVQLLVYAFGSDASFEGRLVGAIERIEAGGALRVLEALYVRRDRDGGELTAFDLRGRGGGVKGETLRELGDGLEPGTALAALLVEHSWARALDDAVERTGGTTVS